MKAAGIIAEYNPFHSGHLYQIEQVRALTGADFVIIAMSGDFVQRGEPAVYDKYTRTAMALNCGADLVLELPVCFATGSAEDFAASGVSLLDKLGTVDLLCFGSESGDLVPLKAAADVLCREPEAYRASLKELLRQGCSYPAARSDALCRYLKDSSDYRPVLSSPNNILAVEYLKALQRQESPIEPFTIRRTGQDYREEAFPSDSGVFASATALRRLIWEQRRDGAASIRTTGFLRGQIPPAAIQALTSEQAQFSPIFPDDLSEMLQYRLLDLLKQKADLSGYADMSPELASRLERLALNLDSFTGRIEQLKTRQYTYTRISRALLHLILGITSAQMQARREIGYTPYARVLGFQKRAVPLLSEIKKSSSIPLVTKTADAADLLPSAPLDMLREDMFASHLYQSLVFQKGRRMKNEYTKSVLVLP